jgi:hypothetical protein
MLNYIRGWSALLFLGLISGAGWGQQSPPVALQVVPKDLAIAAGERRRVLVVATVGGAAVHKLKLRAWPDPGTHAAIGNTAGMPDEVRGDVSWPVWISKDRDGKTTSRVLFEAQYESGDKSAILPGLAQAILDLTVKQLPKNDDIATATVQTRIDKLEERRPQDVYLMVTNVTDVPLEVMEVRVSLPSFARIEVDGKDVVPSGNSSAIYSPSAGEKPVMIPPRQEHIFPLVLKIPDYAAVLSGKYLMLFQVRLRYTKDSYHTESSIVATQEFQAAVLGEQEFVGITSVPFLLLPGFLFVTFFGLLVSKVWPKWAAWEPDFKKPDFYLIGAAASLVADLIYKPLSPWLYWNLWREPVAKRDLFAGFGLEDIINTWVLALTAAVVPWALVCGLARGFAWVKATILKDQTPTPDDEPLDVLLRLQRAGKSFALSQANLSGTRLWELPLPSPDPAKKWVSGRIDVTFAEPDGQPARQFRELLNQPAGTQSLFKFLRGLGKAVTVKWQPEDRRPELVDKKDAPALTGATDEFVCET